MSNISLSQGRVSAPVTRPTQDATHLMKKRMNGMSAFAVLRAQMVVSARQHAAHRSCGRA
jgi:hypothetical protein